MTTETPERRVVDVEIIEATHLTDKSGKPRWAIKGKVPWTKYPIPLQMNREGSIVLEKSTTLRLTLQRGKLVQEGKNLDKDYGYFWDVVAPGGPSEATGATPEGQPYTKADTVPSEAPTRAAPSAVPSYEDRWAREQEGMSRAVALKAAVDFIKADGTPPSPGPRYDYVLTTAQAYYDWLSSNAPKVVIGASQLQKEIDYASAKPASEPDTEATSESSVPVSFRERGWTKREIAGFLEIEVPDKPVATWNPVTLWLGKHQGMTLADAMAECELQAAQQEIDNAPKK